MQVITLSDHATDMINEEQAKRQAAFDADNDRYRERLKAREVRSNVLRARMTDARKRHRWLTWLGSATLRLGHACSPRPQAPRMAGQSRAEVVWKAGSEGERRVAETLAAQLSDDWTLVTGYRNRGGELDQMLVSPQGMLAIEIKFLNGVVHCRDDNRWYRDKYDRYGNLVEEGPPIADRGGRSPSGQVNAVADNLQQFLASRGIETVVSRAVVLSHPSSRLGRIGKLRLNLLATCDQLTPQLLASCMTPLPEGVEPGAVLALVERDHRFHAKRGNQRGGRHTRHERSRSYAHEDGAHVEDWP